MNSKSNYQIALNNNLKRINETILTDIDRMIAEHQKAKADHEQSIQTLMEMKAIAKEYANILICEANK